MISTKINQIATKINQIAKVIEKPTEVVSINEITIPTENNQIGVYKKTNL